MAKTILVFGLPGSGKSTLANKLSKKLDADHFEADKVREQFDDWDFSEMGRRRQAERMTQLGKESKKQWAILDFVCPTQALRDIVSADVVVFMDTIQEGRYEDTNKLFEYPDFDNIDYRFVVGESDAQAQLIAGALMTFDWQKETVQMLGRWQPFHDGHLALFERALAKTGQVAIQVRDCQGWNDSNPFDFNFVKEKIIEKLTEYGYTHGKEYIVMLVPNIINITYGRDVGYKIEQEVFTDEIHDISATKIRKEMGYDK
jgi:GTPase SAR1 family protein